MLNKRAPRLPPYLVLNTASAFLAAVLLAKSSGGGQGQPAPAPETGLEYAAALVAGQAEVLNAAAELYTGEGSVKRYTGTGTTTNQANPPIAQLSQDTYLQARLLNTYAQPHLDGPPIPASSLAQDALRTYSPDSPQPEMQLEKLRAQISDEVQYAVQPLQDSTNPTEREFAAKCLQVSKTLGMPFQAPTPPATNALTSLATTNRTGPTSLRLIAAHQPPPSKLSNQKLS